jgi:site-specific DNA recombinase
MSALDSTVECPVRRIFSLYSEGCGMTRIAKRLNADHAPPPRGHALGWAPTAIRKMLHRERYRGVIVWNRTQKLTRRGAKR